ncbi:MAG: hypothetical protein Q4G05_02675 [Clostridia bacterium]|nr:hypothetical protein [Clostridia bacterium]
MEGVHGKFFSITDPKDVKTVIYKVNATDKQFLKESPKYTIEKLLCAEEEKERGIKKTFFIDESNDENEQLVILSFAKEKVVVNMGILENGKIKISKSPVPMKFNSIYEDKKTEYKNFRYTPNLKRQISIIDPETTEEVTPVLYFDKDTNEVKGKCELQPYKSYFAFEIRD